MKNKLKYLSIPLTILVLSFFVIQILVPEYHPFGGMKITKSKDEVLNNAIQFLEKIDVQFDKNKLMVNLESNDNFIKWIETENHLNKANKILKENGLAFYWNVSQKSADNSNVTVSSNSAEAIRKGPISIEIESLDEGSIIKFSQELNDSSITDSLSINAAQKRTKDFIKIIRDDITLLDDSTTSLKNVKPNIFYFDGSETIKKSNRVDYNFRWKTKNKNQINYILKTTLVGNEIKSFEVEPIIPDEYNNSETDVFELATTLVFVLLIIIAVLIVGFKRFRAYEIGFKHAVIFGIVVLVSFVLKELLDFFVNAQLTMIIGLAAGGIFIAGAGIILWAVSETVFREIWNDKYLSLDLLFHRKFFHSQIGRTIINSISFGFGLTALFLILLYLTSYYSILSFTGEGFVSQSHITASLPLLNAFFSVFNSYAILAVSFFMFLTAAIKRYISNDIIFIIVSGLVWGILIQCNIIPLTAGLPINFIIGISLSIILIKYDLLSTILSLLIFKYLIKVTEFSFLENSVLSNQWYILIAIFVVAILFSFILIFRKDKFTDYDSITPKFVENITERQRLKRELDVARHVQMSFLPKTNPILDGIEIASTCVPAFEVGGDYYDFINLGKNKLGIIIGDVSGKGTQAAFYMTLTKGFLKALAKQTNSPAEVLTRMNELFYENVERGRFISMIYAIVDQDKNIITIARAGHNPIILHDHSGEINLISPNGLALGLEKGNLFAKVITEHKETLTSGKVFIFYTDGFTEAVNKKGEEYGLDRMFEIARLKTASSAKDIQDKLLEDVNKFIGKASQHDDMTMVVLKIK